MSRLIDADALIESLSINPEDCPGCPEPEWLEELADILALAPTVDAMSKLEIGDFGTLAICAIRYCHGRMTYMPDLVRNIIRPYLKELSDKDLSVMIEDCDFQERMHLYGDERIDKPGWLKWKDNLIAEKERRTDENNGRT